MTGRKRKAPAKKKPAAKKRTGKRPPKKKPAAKKKRAARKSSPRRRRFKARGQKLWAAHKDQVEGERGVVLLEEACRIADRLDKLDALLQGDADVWCRLVHDLRTEDYELRVDAALIEARQQANTLRQIVAALPLKEAAPDDEGSWLDE